MKHLILALGALLVPGISGPPKSASGGRWVSIAPFLLPDVIEHLEQFT